ncbi:MAG: ABC transporter permease [Ardenticatenaceae bacterium]|nr:MAG: ABC transporter permease [Ardenticatenaceae bacterium]
MEGELFTVALLSSGLRLATPIILAALGGAFCARAGVLNLALEGKMLLGAFVAIVATYYLGSTLIGILVAILFGGLLGYMFAFFYLKYQVNLIILALAINLLIAEITVYIMRIMFGNVGSWSDPSIQRLPDFEIPLLNQIPIIGDILSGYNFIVYFSWVVCVIGYIVLFHTKFGRHIRAVGENKEAAETLGINVRRVQVSAMVIAGMLCALGGSFLSVGHLSLFTRNMSNGLGWVAVTANIFGFQHPLGVLLTGYFFGLAEAFAVRIQNVTNLPPNLIQLLPQFATLAALILVALREKANFALLRRRFRRQLARGEMQSAAGD